MYNNNKFNIPVIIYDLNNNFTEYYHNDNINNYIAHEHITNIYFERIINNNMFGINLIKKI